MGRCRLRRATWAERVRSAERFAATLDETAEQGQDGGSLLAWAVSYHGTEVELDRVWYRPMPYAGSNERPEVLKPGMVAVLPFEVRNFERQPGQGVLFETLLRESIGTMRVRLPVGVHQPTGSSGLSLGAAIPLTSNAIPVGAIRPLKFIH